MTRCSLELTVGLCLCLAACSTTYAPRPGPGIRVTYSDGQPAFWKDGRVVQKGVFSSQLAAAMADIAEAKRHIETWRSRNLTGLVLGGIGAGLLGTGLGLLEPGTGLGSRNSASLGLMSGGFLTALVATIIVATGQAHLWDGINLYNDRITEPRNARAVPPPPVAPTGLAIRW